MSDPKLNSEERELLDALEKGEYESVLTDDRKTELENAAAHTLKRDKRLNIRLSSRDMIAIQAKAAKEGIPYQTLAASIIHKYISGSLLDVTSTRATEGTKVETPEP
jgi:predicted DNA binding CopG/RHH family protein